MERQSANRQAEAVKARFPLEYDQGLAIITKS